MTLGITVIAAFVAWPNKDEYYNWPFVVAAVAFAVGVIILLDAAIPQKATLVGSPSDGYQLRAFVKGGVKWSEIVSSVIRGAKIHAGVRARYWGLSPTQWRNDIVEPKCDGGWSYLQALVIALDACRFDIVKEVINEGTRHRKRMDRDVRFDWQLQVSAVAAMRDGDVEHAIAQFPVDTPPGKKDYASLCQSAIDLRGGSMTNAAKNAATWLQYVDKQPNPRFTLNGNHWLIEYIYRELPCGSTRDRIGNLVNQTYFDTDDW